MVVDRWEGTGILVGYDGRDSARDAVALARLLAHEQVERLTLVRVVDAHDLQRGVEAVGIGPPAGELAEAVAAETRAAAAGIGAHAEMVAADAPASGLELAAAELGAELLVIGSSEHGRLGQIFAGGVGLRLLHGSSCPVALAPAGYRHAGPALRTVGVGFDGSPKSEAALALAARLAGEHDAVLEIIAAANYGYTDPRLDLVPGTSHVEGQRAEVLADRVAAAASALPADLAVSRVIVPGDPVVVLSDRATALDLLVVGSRGKGPVAGVLLGSVSAELVLATPCPLLVVPGRDRDGER